MDRLLTLLVTLCVAVVGALAWDRHPPVSFTVPIGPFRPRFELPPSLKQERDEAVAEAERLAGANAECLGSLARQNAAVADLERAGAKARRDAEKAVADALRGRGEAAARVSRLRSVPPAGGDLCARYEAADRAVLEALRR